LARALYHDADIYVMDDPISALDVKVASYVVNEGILGFLNGKTRIVFSASMNHLQKFDRIYYIENG
jgi:ABC-type transport system involved in cytochrome bd biosynthesis fused ATPase/permease subunit